MLTNQNLDIYRGEDKSWGISVAIDGPVDLTGAALAFTVRRTYTGTALVTKTVGDGITVTDAANGQATLALVPDDTADLTIATHYYDLVLTLSGKSYTLAVGTFKVLQNIHAIS